MTKWKNHPEDPRFLLSTEGDVLKRDAYGVYHPYESRSSQDSRPSIWIKNPITVSRLRSVGRAVLETFKPTDDPSLWARHLDGNPENNHIDNLAWGTPSQNALDDVVNGANEDHRKVTLRDRASIYEEYTETEKTQKEVADMFGISQPAVSYIIKKEKKARHETDE